MRRLIEALRNGNGVVLDTETTGVDGRAEVLQIGIVSLEGEELYYSLVRPVRARRWDEAMRIHGISPADVRGAPTIGQLAESLKRIMHGRPVAVYNADFDSRMLWQSISADRADDHFVWLRDQQWACVMKAYARFWGQRERRYGNYRWQKLSAACRQQGVHIVDAHDALGDALLTAAVIRAVEQRIGAP